MLYRNIHVLFVFGGGTREVCVVYIVIHIILLMPTKKKLKPLERQTGTIQVQYSYTLIAVGLKLQGVGLILLCLGLTDVRLCESLDPLLPVSR